MATTTVTSGHSADDTVEVVRFNSDLYTDITQLVLAAKRRNFKVTNLGANPVFVGINGQDLTGSAPATLPTSKIAEIPAPAAGVQNFVEFSLGTPLSVIYLTSTGGASKTEVIAGN